MRRPQTWLGAGTLLIGLAMLLAARGLSSDAGYAGVGPNFLPEVVSAGLILCGAWLLWESRTGGWRNMETPSGASQADWPGFVWVSVGILANAMLITTIGFIFSCTLCFVLAVRGFHWAEGRRGIAPVTVLRDAGVGLCIASPVYWMFTQLLGINLPGLTSTGWL